MGRSQVGKAPDFDSGMRWFESSRPSIDHRPSAPAIERYFGGTLLFAIVDAPIATNVNAIAEMVVRLAAGASRRVGCLESRTQIVAEFDRWIRRRRARFEQRRDARDLGVGIGIAEVRD